MAWKCVENKKKGILEYPCPNDSVLYRTHQPKIATEEKKRLIAKKEAEGIEPGTCIVLSAIRDPMLSIPSLFFEGKKRELCDGSHRTEEVLDMYEEFLHGSRVRTTFQVTAELLEEFGVKDFEGAIESLEEDGFTFIANSDRNSPWNGCELLLMMIDYDDYNINIQAGFDKVFADIQFKQKRGREEQFPMAAGTYQALKEYELTDAHLKMMTKDNPKLRCGINFYQKLQRKK